MSRIATPLQPATARQDALFQGARSQDLCAGGSGLIDRPDALGQHPDPPPMSRTWHAYSSTGG
ncbi:MAG: hypothetical protein JJ992_02130, partial [Planctomycetes bacterium]|nr:hypothetical protein [Planctomycetota bacterium]